jgi:hypothetical protein
MKRILSVAIGIGITVMAAHAHHSIAGVYDTTHQVTIEGIVTQFRFVNPHPFLIVDVKDANGTAQQWRLEMDNLSELSEIGVTSGTLKPGDRVIVSGSPGRKQLQSLYIRKLDRPADGFRYEQVGSSPRISTKR